MIEKLRGQIRSGEPTEQLLATLRVLYAEIRGDVSRRGQALQTGSVAVILPSADDIAASSAVERPEKTEARVVQALEVDEKELEEELLAIRKAAEFRNSSSLHHRDPLSPADGSNTAPISPEQGEIQPAGPAPSIPAEPASLNDRLANRGREVSERLAEEPILDLRKAVSLNDRFRFVNELFKGDHGLYDEAIGALNSSAGLGQAMGWIQSECFGKLGWKEDDALGAQFVSLVRRRFL